MQFSAFIAAILSGMAVAQTSAYPKCAQTCLANAPTNCARSDTKCLCADSTYNADVTTCVEANCDEADEITTLNLSNAACGR